MATVHRSKANGENEIQNFDIFAQNMADYFKQRDYLNHAAYFTEEQNFVKDKLQKHLRNSDEFNQRVSTSQSDAIGSQNIAYIGQDTKSRLKADPLVSEFLSNVNLAGSDGYNDNIEMAQYFALANSLPAQKPLLFLQYPPVRHGTDTSSFGGFP